MTELTGERGEWGRVLRHGMRREMDVGASWAEYYDTSFTCREAAFYPPNEEDGT